MSVENRTIIVMTRISEKTLVTTYCNDLYNDKIPYIMSIELNEPPHNPIGVNPKDIPEPGKTKTIIRDGGFEIPRKREPLFKVGQVVYLKDEVDRYIAGYDDKFGDSIRDKPGSLTITQIDTYTCDAGTQIGYRFSNPGTFIPELSLAAGYPDMRKKKESSS